MRQRARKLSAILLVLCMALTLLPGTALAAETSGSCGDNVTWSYSNGTLTISGTGPMADYDYTDYVNLPPWSDYNKDIDTLMIGNGVTYIGNCAFNGCSSLTGVTIPDSVTTIGENAFFACASLTGVTIPDSVTSIGEQAFGGCESLTGVTIPDSVTSIGSYTFTLCSSLAGVTISNSVTTIGDNTFRQCTSLTSVTIPDGVTSIEGLVFAECSSLKSVTIPTSVASIGWSAFADCPSLTDVYYGGSESQWKQIAIDNDGGENAPLLSANIHYNSAPSTGTTPEPTPTPSPAPSASGGISTTVDGKAVTWTDAEPFIDANDRTMVPLRAVADAMSLDVNWDSKAREASFTDGNKTIIFPIDSTTARTSGGGSVKMDTAAVISNDRTYAPIRYLAEFFGYTVGWDAATKTVVITK